ncbi:MAG: hypothetical protein ACKOWF_02855 [Chloroflexota bacterium]
MARKRPVPERSQVTDESGWISFLPRWVTDNAPRIRTIDRSGREVRRDAGQRCPTSGDWIQGRPKLCISRDGNYYIRVPVGPRFSREVRVVHISDIGAGIIRAARIQPGQPILAPVMEHLKRTASFLIRCDTAPVRPR